LFNKKDGGVLTLLLDIRNYLKAISAWYVPEYGLHVYNNPIVPDVLDVAGI
jgi:hypothetical protein